MDRTDLKEKAIILDLLEQYSHQYDYSGKYLVENWLGMLGVTSGQISDRVCQKPPVSKRQWNNPDLVFF